MWKSGKSGAESHLFRVRVGVSGDEERCMNICCKIPPQSIKIIPILRLILDSLRRFTSERSL